MAQAPRLAAGSIFARDYKVVGLLAEGGMGAVYRAEQLSTRKLRALKLIDSRLAADPKGRQRFVREATVGASIDSVHVVEVIGAGIEDDTGYPWLAMEMLDGADLGAVLKHQGPLSPGQLRELMEQMCHGLAAAHRSGVVHRDLKPANVFVARSRRAGVPFTVKILDFGIAKIVQESGSVTTETDTVGSPLWMAPEQLNAQRPTASTDVWALGLLAFWAMSGKHYWWAAHSDASTVQALFVEQLFKTLDPPSQRARELGAPGPIVEGFDAWFARCTSREPAQRFADAAAAWEALAPLLSPDPAAAARLLPDVPLEPSINEPSTQGNAGTTLATRVTNWDASAVVSGADIAAARTKIDANGPTQTSPARLGAELSRGPVDTPSAPPPEPRRVPFGAVMASVAVVVAGVLGLGYALWQAQGSDRPEARPRLLAGGDDDGATGSNDAPAGTTGASASGDTPATAGTGSATKFGLSSLDPTPLDPADPMLELVIPARNQPDNEPHSMQFLGWSPEGHRFVIRADYQQDRRGEPNRLTLVQVHDALSGTMIDAYLVSRDAGPGISSYQSLSKLAKTARPYDQWPARRDALKLEKGRHAAVSPGGGQLRLSANVTTPGIKASFPASSRGLAFKLLGFSAPEQAGLKTRCPRVTLTYARDGQDFVMAEPRPSFSYGQVAARREPEGPDVAVTGRIMAYWSPDGARILLHVVAEGPSGGPPLSYHRWIIRGAGPQIRLIEAGAGQARVREVAVRLGQAGLPVASASLRQPPVGTSSLEYHGRREGAQAVANRVDRALVLPSTLTPQAGSGRNWPEVVLVLGQDML